MPIKLQDVVKFRGDRLFNGAVNIGWFDTNAERTRAAAEAFVFHGPTYHGVSQDDIGVSHGHRLQDTANFALSLIRRCYGLEDQPFTLAIAGYGTGKSHLGLTLATLLSNPDGDVADEVLEGIDRADDAIGSEIRSTLSDANQPCLVVALNGMQNFDLTTEMTRQIRQQVLSAELDTRPLDDLRPRFAHAANLIKMAGGNNEIVHALLEACELDALDDILTSLGQQDEAIYSKVHGVLAARNIPLKALGGESVRDVIDVACREYCGSEKQFRCMAVIFDEFGRYTEFATVRSHIAGSGVLQDLFEGIQANAGTACFAGFIQFDLNAYVQRVAAEHRNEILRYVTRYQSANRVYLSINLETLIASLIEKTRPDELARRFDNDVARQESKEIIDNVGRWFPQSRNHRLWGDLAQFHSVIRRGCWPLSAYSAWFLYHLAAAGKHLQERSALALLGDVFERFSGKLLDGDNSWCLSPVDFWSDSLQHELITSEEGGQQGSITHAYASVFARHATQIEGDLIRLLRAVVLASKMGLKVESRDDAIDALSELAGLHLAAAERGIEHLQDEYNVLEWDESFKEFDILGDAVPRTQFLSFVRHRVASAYDEAGKAALFASKGASWCELLGDLDCDFAEESKITTREWRYTGVTSSLDLLAMQVKLAADKWSQAVAVDEPRGTVIYCYVEPNRNSEVIGADVGKKLRAAAKDSGVAALPILVVLLGDTDGTLGQSLAELAVLDESLTEEDRVRFGNLISAHQEKMRAVVRSQIESMIKQRLYVTAHKEPLESRRLQSAGTELFKRIYKNVLAFPFDGFTTARGNAADSCQELTAELLLGKLDYDGVLGKPVKVKNRAIAVLKDSWGIFARNGKVLTRPSHPVVRALTEKWDGLLASAERRILLQSSLRQLCAPPFGANVASAGLFLGVFVAARSEKICIVRNGQQYGLTQWVQDGLFRGKFVDFGALHDVELIHLGEESSEWDALLDEWEQAESHETRRACLLRSFELKERVPVPPAVAYRQLHLEEQGQVSVRAMADVENQQNEAVSKMERGERFNDANLLSWGAAALSDLVAQMTKESPLWSDHQIQKIQPEIDRTRQFIIQCFPDWLGKQAPREATPDAVGDFKHKMLRLTGGNLRKLGLNDLYEQLEKRTNDIIKDVETAAEANQAIKEVNRWLTSHADATRFVRVRELRALRDVGKEHASKLQGLASRIQMSEMPEVRRRLSEALAKMKDSEEEVVKRATRLWKSKLRSMDDLETLTTEVESLVGAFEGCTSDLEDLQIMRRALRLYQKAYRQLDDERLTWKEFEALAASLSSEAEEDLGEEEIPWPTDEAIGAFVATITKSRKEASAAWIEAIEGDLSSIATMSAADANRLHARASDPPATLVDAHAKRLTKVVRDIEQRLEALKLDWLVERFAELPPPSQKKFLEMAEGIAQGRFPRKD